MASEVLELLRLQRHALANQVQLIASWLELGRPDRARECANRLRLRLQSEAELVRAVPEPVAEALLVQRLRAEARGLVVELEPPPRPVAWPAAQAASLAARVAEAVSAWSERAARGDDCPSVHVSVEERGVVLRWPGRDGAPGGAEVVLEPR